MDKAVVIVSSNNKSKIEGTKRAFEFYGIDCVVKGIKVPSSVNGRPVNIEIINGAFNRNKSLKWYCVQNNINYDYLVSIEAGVFDVHSCKLLETFCYIETKDELTSHGVVGHGIENIFESENNIWKLKEKLKDSIDDLERSGIIGIITNGKKLRDDDNFDVVKSALIKIIYNKELNKLKRKA